MTAQPNAGPNIDQMVLWPNDQNPTHLIVANEEGPAQAGLQRIRLSDGLVETILSGTSSGDPVRRTPWGTILLGEENGTDGWLIEIANPLTTTGVLFTRATGTSSDPAHVVARSAPGRLSWESIALYPSGVMYYGDENRPSNGTPGGAYFKFIPTAPWNGMQGLANSPLAAGTVYGLRVGKRSGNTDYGQGTQTGLGTWPEVQYLVLGSADFAMMDNIAYEPIHGNFVINEDGDGAEFGRNNDIWSCLDDGDDADDQSDGCVRVATLNDLTAESTGGLFDKYGTHYYVSIQHNVTGHGVVLDITGWR